MTLYYSYITMMEERYNYRMNTKGWGKIASPWFVFTQVDESDAKECSVCWDECTSYLHCANSEEHIVCKLCSKEMIENTAFVNPDASIDIKWKCPLCRYDNEIGSWQFLPSTEQIKAKEASTERILQQAQDVAQRHQAPQAPLTPEQQAQQQARQAQRLARARAMAQSQAREREQGIQARQQQAPQQQAPQQQAPQQQAPRLQFTNGTAPQERRRIIENRLSRIDENAPSKFRWVLSLDWRYSIVNHFKAWIMYTSSNYVENINNSPPSGVELSVLKERHHYDERKRSPQAPWFNFLERTAPP